MICAHDGCERPTKARGLCPMHYHRWQRHADPGVTRKAANGTPLADRLRRYSTERESGCIEWTGGLTTSGYGSMGGLKAHRVAWELAHGPIPDGLLVCHHCDNRRCVNPAHMFLGTIADNNADKKAKGRAVAPRGSEQGRSKLTESDIPHLLSRLARGERQVDVGRHFGVSQAVVSAIKRGALWKHV